MRDFDPGRALTLLAEAVLANLVLWIVVVSLYGWAINQSSEPDAMPIEDDPPIIVEVTVIVTVAPRDTLFPTPTAPDTPPPTLAMPVPSPPTPEPTRREFGEPTKPPYVFPTPIYIPAVPPARPTPTRGR